MRFCDTRLGTGLLLAASLGLSTVATAQVGSLIGRIPTPTTLNGAGLGTDPAGNLWFTGTTGEVLQLTNTGTILQQWTASNSGTPYGITNDGTNVFVVDSNANTGGPDVDVYDQAGNYVRSFPLTGIAAPGGIVFRLTTGNLFVVNRTGNTVHEFDRQGTAIQTFQAAGSLIDGIGYDPINDQFWINQQLGDMCDQYDSQFNLLSSFPGATTAVGAPGSGATFLDGVFYVVVRRNREIVMFDTTGTSAGFEVYGDGCPQPGCFYEQFTGTGTGDLTGTGIRFISNGRGWQAVAGGSFETNIGANLNLADDGIQRNQALGFTFPCPGAATPTTTAIDIAANGWVGLTPFEVIDTGFYVGASGAEMIRFARIAAWWDDLNPAAGGGVHFNQLSNPTRAVITWNQVPQFGNTDQNTIQLKLFPNGDMELFYQLGCMDDAIVGYSSGNGVADPGSIDLSMTIPTTFGPYGSPLTLRSNRPQLGATIVYQTSNIPNNAGLAAVVFGATRTANPLDAIGMTGCTQLCSADLASGRINLQTGQFSFPVPNQTSFIGITLTHQSIVFAPRANPLGVIASNGLELKIGT